MSVRYRNGRTKVWAIRTRPPGYLPVNGYRRPTASITHRQEQPRGASSCFDVDQSGIDTCEMIGNIGLVPSKLNVYVCSNPRRLFQGGAALKRGLIHL
jgi:hypothetical protein